MSEWISVKQELPCKRGIILVKIGEEIRLAISAHDTQWVSPARSLDPLDNVKFILVHAGKGYWQIASYLKPVEYWMPLPEPPNENQY